MKLLLDQGNSRLKWVIADRHGEFCEKGESSGDRGAAINALAAKFGHSVQSVHASVVASTEVLDELSSAVWRDFGLILQLARTADRFGALLNGYRNPDQLGVDRWLAVIGARRLIQGSILVVDVGTAMTVDAVVAGGQHLGGYIVPGFRAQCRSLVRETAAVRADISVRGSELWGETTDDAVVSGVRLGLAALIDRAIADLRNMVDDVPQVVITGGGAAFVTPFLKSAFIVDEDLVLKGLLETLSVAPNRGAIKSTGLD